MPRTPRIEPAPGVVARLAATALTLPDAYEEDAWTGVRWGVRGRAFAHVLVAQEGYTSAYREVTGIAAPTTVLTFRAASDELRALERAGHPFYKPPWSATIMGVVLEEGTDWAEIAELVIDSYRFCAPRKLARLLDS